MATQSLTAALERGDPAAIAAAFDPDVSFQTPILSEPLRGREMALQFFGQAEQVVEALTYYDSVEDDERTLMLWRAQVSGRPIEGATLITANESGLVSELTLLMRSWTAVGLFRDAMLRALADVFPLPLWDLRGEHAAVLDPDGGAGRPPGRELAPAVRFHSPMLTRTVSGAEEVHAVHKMIAGIQGPRSYHWRIDSGFRIVEFWSCAIEGHWQHGIDLLELDDDGRVEDQKVWLAPWPVTTLLRDRAIAAQLPVLGPEMWLAPAYPVPLA
jgi:hypothetical protein